MIMYVKCILLFAIFLSVVFCEPENDECSGKPTDKICDIFLMRMAWYYEPDDLECRTFMYGGCGHSKNVYRTEDDCYGKCSEKLITLHAPWNLRVMAVQHNSAALIWYRPVNYNLHEKLLNEYLVNFGDSYTTVNNGTKSGTDSAGDSVHIVPHTTVKTKNSNNSATTIAPTTAATKSANVTVNPPSYSTQASNMTVKPQSYSTKAPNVTEKTPSTSTKAENVTENPSSNATKAANVTEKPPNNSTKAANGSSDEPADPTIPSVEEVPGNSSIKLQDYIGKSRVPFHFARLKHYIVSYKAVMWPNWKNVTVDEIYSYYNLSDLLPDTEYHLKVSAEYQTNTSLETKVVTFRTRQHPLEARKCYCDPHGAKGGRAECNMTSLPWCDCLPGFGGLFCEICDRGFYRTGSTMPCHKCPCTAEASTGSCHFVEGYLHCLKCKEEYSGILCHRCANGYYRDYSTEKAQCIKCVGCHNIMPGRICDPFDGKCLNCHYNTTGEQCDRCLPGFVGDPLKNVPCLPGHSSYKPPPSGVIASIVIGTIVLLSGIVGIIVYRRIQRSPTNRPFWTIEFQEDHDGVNFSSVPDDDADRNVEDLRFYEDHQKGTTKSQPYSRLQEDF